MDVSIVIPLLNEDESLSELTEWIVNICSQNKFIFEIIFIDDGSSDRSWDVISELHNKHEQVKGIRFRRNYGKSAALHTGFQNAKGDVVITMDADLQDNPDEIPGLVKMIRDEGFDLVSGWKRKRFDPISKRIPSKFFNWTSRKVTGIFLHDFNCGLKAYKNQVVKSIEIYGEMHRYIPVLAKWAGFNQIGEKVVTHQTRKYGKTKFGMERYLNGFLDLISVIFISKFGKKPMHLFGTFGTLLFIFGFIFAIYLGARKLYNLKHGVEAILVTESPFFYISLTLMIMGTLLFIAGFLGELMVRNSYDRNKYLIEEEF